MRSGAAEREGQGREPDRRGVPSGSADARTPGRIDAFMDACLDRIPQLWLVFAVPLLLANLFFGWIRPSVGAFAGYFAGVLLAVLTLAAWQTTRACRCQKQSERGAIDAQ